MRRAIRFLRLPFGQKRQLGEAFVWVLLVRLGLWLLPFRVLNRWVPGECKTQDNAIPEWERIKEAMRFVRMTSRFVPYATCLTQALAGRAMLSRIGQKCQVKIGVDFAQEQILSAHAWLVVDGKIVLGNTGDIRRYSILSSRIKQSL